MSKKYVEVNGKQYELTKDGHARLDEHVILHAHAIQALNLEIMTDAAKFEDLPEGIYQAQGLDQYPNSPATSHNRVFKLREGEWWENEEELSPGGVDQLKYWHEKGKLFQLHTKEATSHVEGEAGA